MALYSVLAVFVASAQYLDDLYQNHPRYAPSWPRSLSFTCAEWLPWVPLTLVIFWVTWRLSFGRVHRLVAIAVHVPLAAAVVVVKALGQSALVPVLIPSYSFQVNLQPSTLATNLLMYVAIVASALGLEAHRRYRDRELHASQLEVQLAQARLQALKSQLHPHFLFNTLHAISTLMHRDVDAADRMMSRLSDLLRLSLDTFGTHTVSLRQELDFLRRYLEIEQIRFGDRLAVELDIEPLTLDAEVPSFILQPLVENAVRHGISPRARGGTVRLRSDRDHGTLTLIVEDDGVGLPDGNGVRREGVGLSNTRARLSQLYGEDYTLELVGADPGLRVCMSIPYREFNGSDTTDG